jgi:hypothetical protein
VVLQRLLKLYLLLQPRLRAADEQSSYLPVTHKVNSTSCLQASIYYSTTKSRDNSYRCCFYSLSFAVAVVLMGRAARDTGGTCTNTVVNQIIAKRLQLVKHALPYFETPEKTQQTLSSLEVLWIIFGKLIADAELGTMFCVIDGLDECEESTLRGLLPRIISLLTSDTLFLANGTFKLAIVSRDIPSLQGCIRIRLDPDNDKKVASDIRLSVSARVQGLSRIEGFNDDFQSSVQRALLERAEGMFLWVGYAMYELSQKQTCSEIWEALEDLPSGLPAIYSRMLLRMLLRIPAKRRSTSQAILRWVTMAARPLQLQELAAATDVRPSTQVTTERAIRDAITLCGPLLKVQEQEVSLIHQSARDYMQRKERDSDTVLEAFRLIAESSHLELAQKCLDCIAQSRLQQRVVDLDAKLDCQESPLLRYATLHWPEHAKSYLALNAELLYTLQQFLCTKHTLRRHWSVAYRKEKLLTLPQTIPLLHILCYLGFVPLLQTEVAWESLKPRFMKRINRKDSDGNTALHVATRARDQMVVQVLIDNRAEIHPRNRYNETALHRAAEEGYEEMVRLLLGKGADVNADANDGKTVLHCALSTRGNNTVVRVLFNKGANVNAKDKFGGTALHLATWEMNVGIVQLLVDGGADVNAIDLFGRTVRHSAVGPWRGSEAVVRILVNKGADVNTKESDGSMVLHWAAEAGNEAVV